MSSESKYYKQLLKKLEGFIRKDYLQLLIFGVQAFIAAVLINFTFYSFLELIANFNSLIRTVLFLLFIIIVLLLFFFFLVKPVIKFIGTIKKEIYFDAAVKVGKNFPDIKDELLNSMQLVSGNEKDSLYSSVLIDAAFRNVYKRVESLDFNSLVNFKSVKKIFPFIAAITIFCLLLFLFVPGLNAASSRLINFGKEFIPPQKFIFIVNPGNSEITKGDDLEISVKVERSVPDELFLLIRMDEEAQYQRQKLTADSSGFYKMPLKNIRSSFTYFAEAEGVSSELYQISVIDRPVLETLELNIKPPAYSKIPPTVQKDNGNINSLVGTKVEFKISSSNDLKKAYLEFWDSTIISLKVDGKISIGTLRVTKDNQYRIWIQDQNGNFNLSPITYQVKAVYDAYPSIEVTEPGKDIALANDNRVKLISKLSDDFGFSKLTLHYRLSASKYLPTQTGFTAIEIPVNKEMTESVVNYIWNLTQLTPAENDVYTYYLEIFDNDNISGPKSARSPAFMIRVPSLEEILSNADRVHDETEAELEKTLEEAEQLKKTLEQIDQEMKKDEQKLSWDEKEKIENTLEKFQELQEKVDKINDQLGEMKQNLQENNLLSEETLEKYMELQELMDELTSEEMKRAMEQLQNLLKDMNREMTHDALENFKFDEEQFKKSIERTLNLLKRIQIEQKIDELVKRTEELTEEQENLLEQTQESDLSNINEKQNLAQQQNELTNELNRLEQEMNNLEEKMKELSDMPVEEMQKLLEEFKKQQNQQLSEASSKDLQKNQKQMAMQNQQQLSENMKQMNEMMMQMQDALQQQNQMQTFTEMMKILDNLISLSKKQEALKTETETLDPNSSRLNELVQEQNNLNSSLQKLLKQMADLSQKTFAVTPEMGKAIGEAMKQIQMSIQSMQNRNGLFAANQQSEAMKSLNEAAMMMKNSMEAMMQGGSGGGMMSLMQQLQQLSGQQMSLNNLTQMLQKMQQGGLNPQQQLELQRLSQQQEVISKSLEQLNQEAKLSGQTSKLPADLNDIVKKMQEVITDMNTEKLDDELIQKQENILSRMLDAQRSINERDFEKERESRTGENLSVMSPDGLINLDESALDKIRNELNKAVKEGYSKDYEELIRRYYEALQSEQKQN